jgi:hypothetical protein
MRIDITIGDQRLRRISALHGPVTAAVEAVDE